MSKEYKNMSHEEFIKCIDKICKGVQKYIAENNIVIDYICPILRGGVIPAVYISQKLNIIKFLPIQVKHIAYKNGENKIDMIFNPFNALEIKKEEPVFLLVEGMQSTGTSAKICIDEIKNRYNNAKIMYVCLTKQYGGIDFKDITIYENSALCHNGDNEFSEEKCKELGIEYFYPIFPWENLKMELEHPDDLEENIFF